ncbi:acyl-CoA-binding protein [Flavobacteriaceae bacterium S356]|uniref:Acyl-CoA-binding protein n=1 Tax=Asprobacillus argus TaxID=3076534 RepID=A0ABU3LHD1_9FLAO|nr:acyl-CoA-binding protein [Flavobacteriaceae bacterium S356]
MAKDLDIKFDEAFEKISALEESIAPDLMLKLYAYYKQGTSGDPLSLNTGPDVRNAFKFNAWMQLNGMTQEDAKKEYIKLAKKILS